MKTLLLIVLVMILAVPCGGFMKDGCGSGECKDCHSLNVQEAAALLQGGVDRVLNVEFSEINGLWVVEVEKDRRKFPLYVDFSKSYLVAGNIIRLKDGQNVTGMRQAKLNRVDVSKIPVADALLLGKPDAKTRAIVFTDPECLYCKLFHVELKEVVRRDPEIAFLIKLFPLRMHPSAYSISKSIVCAKSLAMLEASFAGKAVPSPSCETKAVDETLALVGELGIKSTPTLVLPDGSVFPGFRKAEQLLGLLGSQAVAEPAGK